MTTAQDDAPTDPQDAEEPAVPLEEPAEGVPPVVESERTLDDVARAVGAGQGPVAIDAERASGYRYGQRAYLVQLRREGAGTFLIDPISVPDLSPVAESIGGAEWILHAATQDLACLAEVGLRPRQLFDTELAAGSSGCTGSGWPRSSSTTSGCGCAKEHSAVDWSTRPLPDPWLRYAALDVEVLGELRNLMGVDLAAQGKDEWARQEFDGPAQLVAGRAGRPVASDVGDQHAAGSAGRSGSCASSGTPATRSPASGTPRSAGCSPTRRSSTSPKAAPRTTSDLPSGHRAIARYGRHWVEAVRLAEEVPEAELPPRSLPSDGPPPPRSWADKNPVAAERLAATRAALTAFAEKHTIPVENVCSPDPLRRVVWSPPEQRDVDGFTAALEGYGVRRWQADIVAPMLVAAFDAHPDA